MSRLFIELITKSLFLLFYLVKRECCLKMAEITNIKIVSHQHYVEITCKPNNIIL